MRLLTGNASNPVLTENCFAKLLIQRQANKSIADIQANVWCRFSNKAKKKKKHKINFANSSDSTEKSAHSLRCHTARNRHFFYLAHTLTRWMEIERFTVVFWPKFRYSTQIHLHLMIQPNIHALFVAHRTCFTSFRDPIRCAAKRNERKREQKCARAS